MGITDSFVVYRVYAFVNSIHTRAFVYETPGRYRVVVVYAHAVA